MLKELPSELIYEIIIPLSGKDTLQFLQSDRDLYDIIKDEALWKRKLLFTYPSLDLTEITDDYAKHYTNLERQLSKLIPLYYNDKAPKTKCETFITTLYLHQNMYHGQLVKILEDKLKIDKNHLFRISYRMNEREFINTSFEDRDDTPLDEYPPDVEDYETGELIEVKKLWYNVTKILVSTYL